MSRPGAGGRLVRALAAAFAPYDVALGFDAPTSRAWTSVTFSGERHALDLIVTGTQAGAAVDAFLAGLTDADIPLPGHLLVDIAVVSDERETGGSHVRLRLEALTVEAG